MRLAAKDGFRLPSLRELGARHGTDKGDDRHMFQGLTYLDVYERYFKARRREPISLLEIGVRDGASLRMWKQYFPNGRIYGVDIDPGALRHQEDRIAVTVASQDDETTLRRLAEGAGGFDVVIDDGSHVNSLTLSSFRYLFHHVLAGGAYVIEDLQCSYLDLTPHVAAWPGMAYNDASLTYRNDRADIEVLFRETLRAMDFHEGDVLALHFWPMMCFVLKAQGATTLQRST
jgi:hypothetical protein